MKHQLRNKQLSYLSNLQNKLQYLVLLTIFLSVSACDHDGYHDHNDSNMAEVFTFSYDNDSGVIVNGTGYVDRSIPELTPRIFDQGAVIGFIRDFESEDPTWRALPATMFFDIDEDGNIDETLEYGLTYQVGLATLQIDYGEGDLVNIGDGAIKIVVIEGYAGKADPKKWKTFKEAALELGLNTAS